ncbi:MAG: DUF1648 domain-containing protein [Halodesulfurarchaeum sp.]
MPFKPEIDGIALGLATVPVLAAFFLWGQLPAELAVHWSGGQPDGYLPKPLGTVGLLALAAGAIGFLRLAPDRLTSTPGGEDLTVLFLGVVFGWVETIVLVWNLGFRFPVEWAVLPVLILTAGLVVLGTWLR